MTRFFILRRIKGWMVWNIIITINILVIFLLLKQGLCGGASNEDIAPNVYRIENGHIKLEYNSMQNTFVIINKDNKRIYPTDPVDGYNTINVKMKSSTCLEITLKLNEGIGNFNVLSEISLEDERIKGVLKADKDSPLKKPIIFPGAISGQEEQQHFVIPYAEGIYVPANEKYVFGGFPMWGHKSTMPFVGMTDSRTGIMVTSDTPADTSVEFTKPEQSKIGCTTSSEAERNDQSGCTTSSEAERNDQSGNYLMSLNHYPVKGKFDYDRIFYIDLVDSDGYNEMAKIFRKHLETKQNERSQTGNQVLVTLKEKLKNNKNVNKLIGSVDFWLGSTEMKNKNIIDDLISNGVKKAVINFQYGWVVYEDEKRPEVIQYAVDKGFISSKYDCYSDIFDKTAESICPRYQSDGFNERTIINESGGFQEGYKSYYKGNIIQGYRINSKFSVAAVDELLGKDLEENNYLGRFVDVAVSCGLYEDYSNSHPMTKREDMQNRVELLDKISSKYGMITGTEETNYWAVPYSHYSEGTMTIVPPGGSGDDWNTPTDNPGGLYLNYTVNPAVRIPLKSLVYHDCNVSGWYTGDGISKVMQYWRTKDLLTVLYGSMNLIFPPDNEFWKRYKREFLWSIKVTGWVFKKVGYEKMERHEFLCSDGLVQKTQFSNGVDVIANFSGNVFHYGKISIPAQDFILVSGKNVYTSTAIAKS